jgi:hypothetical protein
MVNYHLKTYHTDATGVQIPAPTLPPVPASITANNAEKTTHSIDVPWID